MFEVNVRSGVRLTRTNMKGRLARSHGGIIFIFDEVALMPMALYITSKATPLSISRSLT